MSTDLRDRTSDPSPDERPGPTDKPKGSLSLTQVVGGALAAMTAAALGSRLSVAGTVIGAALASVVAAVGTSVYTSSLRRTHQTVSAVLKGRGRPGAARSGSTDPGATASTVTTATTPPTPPAASAPSGTTWAQPAETRVDATGASSVTSGSTRTAPVPVLTGRRRIGWKPVLAGALLMFAIAAVALTGIELVTGHALSGGSGTTVGQVAEGGPRSTSRPSGAATASPTSSASRTASARPSATASSTPSSEPTARPTTSETAAPTPGTTPTLSASPTAAPSSPAAASNP